MADQRILYTENMVGANHPTLADTLNRMSMVAHENDGTHKFVLDATDSSSSTTGAIVTAGGLGVAKAANIGTNLAVAGVTDASSSTTGSLKTAGGLGVAKKAYVGTDLSVGGNATVTGTVNGTTIPASKTLVVTTDKLSALAATTSAELAGVISDETGSGVLVFATSPALAGTPTAPTAAADTDTTQIATTAFAKKEADDAQAYSIQRANHTGTQALATLSDLNAAAATFLATPTSANLAAAITDETGSGAAVFANSPTLTTPVLGVATATSINKITLTAPATGSTLTIADGKTLTASSSLTLAGTDGSTLNVGTGGTLGTAAYTAATDYAVAAKGVTNGDTHDHSGGDGAAIPIASGVAGLGTGVATALAVDIGSAGAPVVFNGALGTPSSGTVTNLTGTASININGTVGATTPAAGTFTTLTSTGNAAIGDDEATDTHAVKGATTLLANSSATALTVTQTGSGSAFVVEDSASPDSTPFIIDADGRIGIGGAPAAGRLLNLTKQITGSTLGISCFSFTQIQSDVTADARGFSTAMSTQAATFTLTSLAHFYAFQSTFGANSTVTSQYGYLVHPSLIGATNNYGFYSTIPSGTGRWNVYIPGTAANYFAGDMQFDKTVTAAATTGDQTINKNAGSVNFAAAASTLTVTNSRVTANSIIVATVATNDTTMKSVAVVAGAGSFVLHANAAATAETRVNFWVVN